VVGVTTDRTELKEIQNIVKVFVVAERIIDLASEIKSELPNTNKLKSPREFNNHPNQYNKYLRPLTVRGLN
jgi:hypothetical protein